MTALQHSFEIPESVNAIGLIEAGQYSATLLSLVEDQAEKDGQMYYRLVGTWRLDDGRELRTNYNIGYPASLNPNTGRIAREEVQAMAHALGVRGALSDTDQVIGRKAVLTVVVNGNYNNVRSYEPAAAVSPVSAVAGPTPTPFATSNPFGG